MSAIFISDVHLKDGVSVKSRLVVRFLNEIASQFEQVFILGDLFDVWPGTNPHLVKTYEPILTALGQLVKNGRKLHYVEGNHDFHLGNFFRHDLGIQVHEHHHVEEMGGKKVFMMHGDLGNPKQLGYQILRFILRRELLHLAMKAVPGEWIYRVGLRSSNLSRDYQVQFPENTAAVRDIYRNTATELFKKGYDVVIMGHTHIPDDFATDVGGRACRYLNTGDWVQNFTYLEFNGGQFYTRTHPLKKS